jgi:hypothetical protein
MLFILLSCLLVPRIATAQWELLGGWEGDTNDSGYAFTTLGYTHPLSSRIGLTTRLTGGYLYYSFKEDGGKTKVKSPGGSILVGPRFTFERTSIGLLVGPQFNNTREETRTSTGHREESDERIGAAVNGSIWHQFNPSWEFLGIANYDSTNHYTWGRSGVKYRLTEPNRPLQFQVGPELTLHGNADIFSVQGGGLFEVYYNPAKLSLGVRLGYKHSSFPQSSSRDDLYWGLGFYTQF